MELDKYFQIVKTSNVKYSLNLLLKKQNFTLELLTKQCICLP